jgi:hypothetical protein
VGTYSIHASYSGGGKFPASTPLALPLPASRIDPRENLGRICRRLPDSRSSRIIYKRLVLNNSSSERR